MSAKTACTKAFQFFSSCRCFSGSDYETSASQLESPSRDMSLALTAMSPPFDVPPHQGGNWHECDLPAGRMSDPFEVRKATLASLLRARLPGLQFNQHLTHPGDIEFGQACKMGLEGIVSKRLGSRYVSGRSKD
jgi:hypothetical protein